VSNLLIELIIQAVLVHADYTKGSRSDLVLRLLAEEIRVSDELPFYLPTPRDKRIALISTTLRDNPDNILTISEWAEKTGLASRTILRLFLKETGMTFSAWRTQARLLNALKRIASGEKIIDIAYQCGYASPSAFTAMFKRYFGVPPSSFYKPGKK
jgi:AraC-like DNA-binding protein